MKIPRPRIHLVDVCDPLLNYSDLTGRCGANIAHGEPKFMFTEDSPRVYQVGTCRHCILGGVSVSKGKRYEYGIMEAEEALHLEETA